MNTISGRRKEATAVVRLTKGTGVVTVNKKSIDEYFGRDVAKMIVRQPLVLTKNAEAYDVDAKVQGGGSFGQAGAIRLAISKALLEENPELRAELKKAGYLTRDSRVKERKKRLEYERRIALARYFQEMQSTKDDSESNDTGKVSTDDRVSQES